MMLQHYFGILVIVTFAKLHEALKQCHASTYSVYGHNLSRHVISTSTVSRLSDCVMMCSDDNNVIGVLYNHLATSLSLGLLFTTLNFLIQCLL